LKTATGRCEARKAAADYNHRDIEADVCGDKGLVVQLEDLVRDESPPPLSTWTDIRGAGQHA
jgi:hypothetical protein